MTGFSQYVKSLHNSLHKSSLLSFFMIFFQRGTLTHIQGHTVLKYLGQELFAHACIFAFPWAQFFIAAL